MKAILSCAVFAAGLAVAADAPSVKVVGPSGETRTLSAADLQKLAVRELNVADPHSKEPARYRGVAVSTLLGLVGTPSGETLRGKALVSTVLVEAADGYRVAFSLAEMDPAVGSTDAYLAFELDGKLLSGELGAFRLVVPTDKRAARWVRQVVKISVRAGEQ